MKADFAVAINESTPYVMASICTCGVLSVAFGDEAHGMFTGTCINGHLSNVMAS